MRIAIVSKNQGLLELSRRVILRMPGHAIVWLAESGPDALEKCAADTPDLIMLELIAGDDSVIGTIRYLTVHYAVNIILVTESIEKNAGLVFDAMGAGARDVIKTPGVRGTGLIDGGEALSRKIAAFSKIIGKVGHKKTKSEKPQKHMPGETALVAIGSSTGGPKVLARIISGLPKSFRCALVVVQHMDTGFSSNMAEWLNEQSLIPVRLVREGDRPLGGTALVAGGDRHLVMAHDLSLTYVREPLDCPYRPSIDQFFQSLAQFWPRRDKAVLLTGMGRDGAQGLLTLRQMGWKTVAQDEATSSVYGMPKAAAEIGAAGKILPPDEILNEILAFCTNWRERNE